VRSDPLLTTMTSYLNVPKVKKKFIKLGFLEKNRIRIFCRITSYP
jgi:hypothetical protein